jgi:hypothetical protein
MSNTTAATAPRPFVNMSNNIIQNKINQGVDMINDTGDGEDTTKLFETLAVWKTERCGRIERNTWDINITSQIFAELSPLGKMSANIKERKEQAAQDYEDNKAKGDTANMQFFTGRHNALNELMYDVEYIANSQ